MKVGTAALLPLSIVFVVLAVGSTLSPCLGCFYYSEDLVQVWLAWLELTTHPELIAQHFTMPWFQCSNMGLFYRPVVQMSYITDFLLYGRHVAGFHLTNLTCHVISSVMCLLITRHLINKHRNVTDVTDATFDTTGATVTGLVAALLFGLNPLQCEPIYWLCCRCDGLCTMFSLSSIYLALLSLSQAKFAARRHALTLLSVVACLLAILAKEQAVFVPFILLLYYWMYHGGNQGDGCPSSAAPAAKDADRKARALAVGRSILPYFVILALYSAVRLTVLGGLGGYHGTIGYLLDETMIQRLCSPTAWSKIFYPLDQSSFVKLSWLPLLYSLTYVLMAVGSLAGWKANTFDQARFKLIKFLALSSLIVLMPAYQSFLITESLFGGRCIYMSQAFMCMALAVLLICFRPIKLRNILIPAYLLLLVYTSVLNGATWVDRGKNLQEFQTAVNKWAAKCNPEANKNRRLCLLNMPLDAEESSSLYDLEQLRCLLRPPINSVDNADRVVQPTYLRMSPDAVNRSRMKALIEDKDIDFVVSSVALGAPFTLIDRTDLQKHFLPINATVSVFPAQKAPEAPEAPRGPKTEAYELSLAQIGVPQRADYVAVTVAPLHSAGQSPGLKTTDAADAADAANFTVARAQPLSYGASGKSVFLLWYTDLTVIEPYINFSAAKFIDDGQARTYIFPIGDRTSWKYAGKVFHLTFANLPVAYKIVRVKLRDEATLVPSIKATSTAANVNDNIKADGFLAVNDRQNVDVFWDASRVAGAASTMLQISLPDFMYSLYADGFREFDLEKHSLKTINSGSLCGQTRLTRKDFPIIGKYQARVAACDKTGHVIGYCSDPVDLMVTDQPFGSALDKAIFNLRAQRQK